MFQWNAILLRLGVTGALPSRAKKRQMACAFEFRRRKRAKSGQDISKVFQKIVK
jgi:hypothetical protein